MFTLGILSTPASQRYLNWSNDLLPLEEPIAQALSLALIPIGVVAVGLYGICVELYFHTNSFVEEYSDTVTALVIHAKGELSAKIEQLTQLSSGTSKQAKLGSVLPIPVEDVTEQLLTEIRRIGAEADEWLDCIGRGKGHLRSSAAWLAVVATVIVALVFILTLNVPVNTTLIVEYAGGFPTILFIYNIFKFRSIEAKLDKARID